MSKIYYYGMRLRGCAPGCQPEEGFKARLDSVSGKYHDIISYDRLLTKEEEEHFSLTQLMMEPDRFIEDETADERISRLIQDKSAEIIKEIGSLLDIAPEKIDAADHRKLVKAQELLRKAIVGSRILL